MKIYNYRRIEYKFKNIENEILFSSEYDQVDSNLPDQIKVRNANKEITHLFYADIKMNITLNYTFLTNSFNQRSILHPDLMIEFIKTTSELEKLLMIDNEFEIQNYYHDYNYQMQEPQIYQLIEKLKKVPTYDELINMTKFRDENNE